ncbi:MAG: homoserine O-succinyltransferase [Clostridia bacterium]|nr:homoserine O-succinyltransferase [Clostridia bacterium]MBQ6859951.1 homoserine O-succinyltransferase [Clostridia bacterium]MBQ7051492.1 homoserine O-succinyltransferase [Clostridia bacterium]
MPIKIPESLPARATLESENIFTITERRAVTQDIRPLRILLLNLMPTKIVTETQLARLLGNSPLQIELELIMTTSRESRNTSREHMLSFYKTFDDVKHQHFDGMVITGAPVEQMEFEQVDYWEELCRIMEWSKTHVTSTFHICWGAQAGLYYHFGVRKIPLDKKLFGVFEHRVERRSSMLLRGFDDTFCVPHSRHTTIDRADIERVAELKILASSEEAGIYAIATDKGRQIFITGHSEYDAETLKLEYERDKNAGLPIDVPKNYFPGDDDTQPPRVTWRSHANLIYTNWLNYYVYQRTPYIIDDIAREKFTLDR